MGRDECTVCGAWVAPAGSSTQPPSAALCMMCREACDTRGAHQIGYQRGAEGRCTVCVCVHCVWGSAVWGSLLLVPDRRLGVGLGLG